MEQYTITMEFQVYEVPREIYKKNEAEDQCICDQKDKPWNLTWVWRKTAAAAAAKSLQSCPTLCDPRDGSPPGYPVPGILQARTLEWVAISFSNA